MITSIMFYLIAALIIFCAIKMVMSTNLVHSALFMAATFIGIAMIYLLLNADYLAIVQIMVYVGAISILIVFGVMLTKRATMEESSSFNRYKFAGSIVAVALFAVFSRTIIASEFTIGTSKAGESTVMAIATLLLNDYAIAFEVAGFLLLVATVGAIIIGKGAGTSK